MMYFWSTILSAFILGPVVVLLQKTRKENKEDHAVVAGLLQEVRFTTQEVEKSVDKVAEKLEKHIDWHLNKE